MHFDQTWVSGFFATNAFQLLFLTTNHLEPDNSSRPDSKISLWVGVESAQQSFVTFLPVFTHFLNISIILSYRWNFFDLCSFFLSELNFYLSALFACTLNIINVLGFAVPTPHTHALTHAHKHMHSTHAIKKEQREREIGCLNYRGVFYCCSDDRGKCIGSVQHSIIIQGFFFFCYMTKD